MRPLVVMVLVVVACSGGGEPAVTSAVPTTVATTVASTSTTAPPEPCPPAPYELGWLPPTIEPAESSEEIDDPDEFTSIGGTHARIWVDVDDQTAIALVRGALPPQDWPAERGEVDIADSRGVAGPYPDGRWVVAWFNEPGDRCDQYTMIFYPPISPEEVEQTLSSMTRLPG